jgi:hypothetical protein
MLCVFISYVGVYQQVVGLEDGGKNWFLSELIKVQITN